MNTEQTVNTTASRPRTTRSVKNRTTVKGKFSTVSGTTVRHVYTTDGQLLGFIRKQADGTYEVHRTTDNKRRVKPTLDQAFATIARAN
jgi:hypothetical protein